MQNCSGAFISACLIYKTALSLYRMHYLFCQHV